MIESTRIAIVGVGSIGSRHIDNLLAMGYQDLVGVDPRPMPHEERLPVVSEFRDLEAWRPTHALICSPPWLHFHHAKYFVDQGIPTFIEKPMTVSNVEASELCATAHLNKSILAVGYMERAHPTVQEVYSLRSSIRKLTVECFWMAQPKTYNLDVMAESSHALDVALWLLGPIQATWRSATQQVATVKIRHISGASSTINMSMNADQPYRKLTAELAEGNVYTRRYGTTSEEWDTCYKAEMQAFLGGAPLCTGEDGLKVVEILEEVERW